jgi:hypothetical protein
MGVYVIATVGSVRDSVLVTAQRATGDTWTSYTTPDYMIYKDTVQSIPTQFPPSVVEGATVAIGSGVVVNATDGNHTGQSSQEACNWVSSFPAVATVDQQGLVTAVSSSAIGDGGVAGKVTITCTRTGNAAYADSTISGWQTPGNYIQLTVTPGGTSNQTWYVRPDGGTPYVDASTTPSGQCDGKHDASYASTGGTGVNQPCAMGNIRYLWSDEVTYQKMQWMISGGDTVIVRQKSGGYTANADSYSSPGPNCSGAPTGCYMPTIPSGTSTRHTRILGENYASCTSDSAKTLLNATWGATTAINTMDSQFVDVACLEVTDQAGCAANGNFSHGCSGLNAATDGIMQSALTASVNYTDLFIHGLDQDGIMGAPGAGVVLNRVHIRATPDAGINLDDVPWTQKNISVAGGFTMKNSTTEFVGCVEEYPIVHNYPYIECRGGNQGGYADAFGTANTVGDWLFDHDVWKSNLQDGLDLLHSDMNSLTVTNSISEHNNGQTYKIGSGRTVIFRNNIALHDCNRNALLYGDEPSTAIVPNGDYCRANDGTVFAIPPLGTLYVQNNTFLGVQNVVADINCVGGWDSCTGADTKFQNNIVLGYGDDNSLSGPGVLPAPWYSADSSTVPDGTGWQTRDHNDYYNTKFCPSPLNTGETCNSPLFTVQYGNSIVPTPISNEVWSDTVTENLTSGSTLKFAGITISGTSPDMNGTPRATPNPSMGALEFITNPSTAAFFSGSSAISGSGSIN